MRGKRNMRSIPASLGSSVDLLTVPNLARHAMKQVCFLHGDFQARRTFRTSETLPKGPTTVPRVVSGARSVLVRGAYTAFLGDTRQMPSVLPFVVPGNKPPIRLRLCRLPLAACGNPQSIRPAQQIYHLPSDP